MDLSALILNSVWKYLSLCLANQPTEESSEEEAPPPKKTPVKATPAKPAKAAPAKAEESGDEDDDDGKISSVARLQDKKLNAFS